MCERGKAIAPRPWARTAEAVACFHGGYWWESDCTPALGAYLLQNGHLLRTGKLSQQAFGDGPGGGPGAGGRIQEFTWEGKLVWDFKFASDKQLPHHDICKLPNGNVFVDRMGKEDRQAGRCRRTPPGIGG